MTDTASDAARHKPKVIGADHQFLLDGSDGCFRVMFMSDMIEMIERDSFYPDDKSALQDGTLYLLRPGETPEVVTAVYSTYDSDSSWVYKNMQIFDRYSTLIAQRGYEIPTLESLNRLG